MLPLQLGQSHDRAASGERMAASSMMRLALRFMYRTERVKFLGNCCSKPNVCSSVKPSLVPGANGFDGSCAETVPGAICCAASIIGVTVGNELMAAMRCPAALVVTQVIYKAPLLSCSDEG